MGSEWSTLPFKEVLCGGTRNGIYKKKEFHGSGVKIVNMGELFANPRLFSCPMKRVELTDSEKERFLLKPGDLLFARRSLVASGAGKCSIVMSADEPTTFESSIIRARPNRKVADGRFLYYLFSSPHGRHLLDTIRRQVAVAGITGTDLGQLEVPVPPLSDQHRVAETLGTLDDKIELNRQMNGTLEAMARAIFKAWFVDFEPVKAKAAGATSFRGMPQPVFDQLTDSELGPVPEGWERLPLAEVTEYLKRGISPKYIEKGGVCVINQRCIRDRWIDLAQSRRHNEELKSVEGRELHLLDVLVNSTGVGTLGRVAQVFNLSGKTIVDSHVTVVRADPKQIVPEVLGYDLSFRESEIEMLGHGSTGQTELSRTRLGELLVIKAPSDVQEAFARVVRDLNDKRVANWLEAQTLAALRDTLLPKLISGELRVPVAEAGSDGG